MSLAEDTLRQCWLKRGSAYQMAWLPNTYAVKGKPLEIKGEDGWIVQCAYQSSPPAYVFERKSHRRGDFGSLVSV